MALSCNFLVFSSMFMAGADRWVHIQKFLAQNLLVFGNMHVSWCIGTRSTDIQDLWFNDHHFWGCLLLLLGGFWNYKYVNRCIKFNKYCEIKCPDEAAKRNVPPHWVCEFAALHYQKVIFILGWVTRVLLVPIVWSRKPSARYLVPWSFISFLDPRLGLS